MKTLKNTSAIFISIISAIILLSCSSSKNTAAVNGVEVKNLLDSQRYIFVAQTVLPMGGRTRQLTPTYNLVVSADSITSDLPYFGRAYTAPVNSSEGGIKFTSTKFEYNVQENNAKGKWDVVIKPKDARDIRELNLTIFESGSATLQVMSINRQPISFNGYIDRKKS